MRLEHDARLALVGRQLSLLQAGLLKEQEKLQSLLDEKTRALQLITLENEKLKRQNKKLVNKQLSQQDVTTSSGEGSSPHSSFSIKTSSPGTLTSGPSPADTPPSRPTGPKPPVPSRAHIQRRVMPPATLPTRTRPPPTPPSAPPPPPVRSTSLSTSTLERVDSGRESDLTTSDVEAYGGRRNHDEGFCSSHEDGQGAGTGSRGRLTLNHRNVQKLSDIKSRSKAKQVLATGTRSGPEAGKPISGLTALEENEPPSSATSALEAASGRTAVPTVTYWSGPFL